MKVLWLSAILLGLLKSSSSANTKWALASDVDICTLFPNGAVLRKPGTCDQTITCQDGVSTPGPTTCTTADQGYKLETKKCAKVTDDYCSTPCVKGSYGWVSDLKNCNEWVKCDNKTQVSTGTCPSGQVFNVSEQRCHSKPANYKCDKVFDVCNVAPQDQFFWDEFNCHKYFYCDKSQNQKTATCDLGNYYDKVTGVCIPKAQVNCYKHPTPENACGTAKLAIRDRFISDQATCSGYFYCKDYGSGVPDTSPHWGICGDDLFFDESKQGCRDRTIVDCEEDRCDGRKSGLELSSTKGCQHYLVCEEGVTMDELKCDNDMYFDETQRRCVETKLSYPVCS